MCERERAAERARCLPFSFLLDASNLDNRETQPPPSPPLPLKRHHEQGFSASATLLCGWDAKSPTQSSGRALSAWPTPPLSLGRQESPTLEALGLMVGMPRQCLAELFVYSNFVQE